MIVLENRPRNKEGKFVKFSPLGDKNIGLRLYKEDQEIFLKIAEEFNMSPTELARYAIREWLKIQKTRPNLDK